MRLWLSKKGGIPLKDQLTRQMILAITSGDLTAGDKLPSIRELGRRYKIHPNTVLAAYRWLEENGWTVSRPGSGIYVKTVTQARINKAVKAIDHELDTVIGSFISDAKQRGFSTSQIKSRLAAWLDRRKPQNIVLVEQDNDMACILKHELSEKFDLPISVAGDKIRVKDNDALTASISDLPNHSSFVKLRLNSVQESIHGKAKPKETDLIGIASHWEQFRRWSQTVFVAVGINEHNLVVRDTRQTNWQDGLRSCKFVVVDSLTAKDCVDMNNVSVFRLISDDSLYEIQTLIDESL